MRQSSAEIKRQILKESDITGIKKRILEQATRPEGLTEDEIVEIGENLERMTATKGWNLLEGYMFDKINPLRYLYASGEEKIKNENKALGYMELIQWIDQHIKAKEAIIASRKEENPGNR